MGAVLFTVILAGCGGYNFFDQFHNNDKTSVVANPEQNPNPLPGSGSVCEGSAKCVNIAVDTLGTVDGRLFAQTAVTLNQGTVTQP